MLVMEILQLDCYAVTELLPPRNPFNNRLAVCTDAEWDCPNALKK